MSSVPPFSTPVIVMPSNAAIIPSPFMANAHVTVVVSVGACVGWAPMPGNDHVLLSIWGGTPLTAGPIGDNVTTMISREGLRCLIEDLQDIDAQLAAPL